ncbi:MAG: hypothetical protein KY455_12650 [Euryarchaeota archaeon]|nr:hypothetical protein [Euryarchaeota archaeon]
MGRVALKFAYLGRLFDSYARQPDPRLRTVEEALLDRAREVGLIEDVRASRFASGSRTDRGVSARENVCAFDTDRAPGRVVTAMATRTGGVWPLGAAYVADDWDPRRPEWREYRYHLYGPLRPDCSRQALAAALAPFVGQHDFTAYARPEPGRKTVRVVLDIEVLEDPHGYVVAVRGRDFLWRQVRRMVAAATAVASGEAPVDEIVAGLADPRRAVERGTAPSWPLVLWRIHHPDIEWVTVPAIQARVRERLSWRLANVRVEEGFLAAVQEDRPTSGPTPSLRPKSS